MSTILDSLKKSSHKRDNHEKTSIDNFNFGHSTKSSKSGLIMIIILMVFTTVTMVYAYKFINGHFDTPEKMTVKESTTAQLNEVETPPIEDVSEEKSKRKLNIKRKQKPNSEAVKLQLAETKLNAETQKPVLNNADSSETNSTEVKSDQIDKNNLNNTKTRSKNKSNFLASRTNSNPSTIATDEKPMIKLELPEDSNSEQKLEIEPTVSKQDYLYVYQLPFTIRKEIPKFTLNIHIYDENPENRVAVINGVKFAVNDLIEEQVIVKEIVRDGVLLEFNNYVFLIPIL